MIKPKIEKFLSWLISKGKVRANLYYFLIFCIIWCIIYIVLDALQIIEFKRSDLTFVFILGGFHSLGFFDRINQQREKREHLKKSGRTEEDLERLEFVQTWEKDRLVGRTRYCLQNGGVVIGMTLIVPISFIALIITSISGNFPSMNADIAFLLLLIPLCYLSGALIYLIRWNSKERKFKRLTGESYLVI